MTLYAIRPPSGANSLEDGEVVSESKYGWDFLKHAIMLWRLVDNARANEIEAIKDRLLAGPDEKLRIDTDDLHRLVRLLSGVDDALVAAGQPGSSTNTGVFLPTNSSSSPNGCPR